MTSAILYDERLQTLQGWPLGRATFVWTGLTPNGANTLPFPNALPNVPRSVSLNAPAEFNPFTGGGLGVLVTLDTSQGAPDPSGLLAGGKLGCDQNNLYVYIGNGTQVEATVEWIA